MSNQSPFIALLEEGLKNFPVPEHPIGLYDPVRYFLALPGKRIRPVFVLQSLALFREPTPEDAVAALATELFHNFSLVHDDMMDNADLRRGFATVHKKWDEPTALLAGDGILVLAYNALLHSRVDDLKELLSRFNQMALAVCEGQQLDMEYSRKPMVSAEEYFQMIDRKTGALIAFSFELGGFLGGASARQRQTLFDFGLAMGRCFQLRDDYLDLFGNEHVTGKVRGGDVANRKLTYPILQALNHSKNQDFVQIWDQWPFDDVKRVQAALAWMENHGIAQQAAQRMEAEMNDGLALFDHLHGHEAARKAILDMCKQLAYREK